MTTLALTCPQCGGPLPRAAMWRMVSCPHCKAVVTRSADVVERAAFRAAWRRSQSGVAGSRRVIDAGDARYAVVASLGQGEHSTVLLAERLGPFGARVVIKLARDAAASARLVVEARHLDALQALDVPGAAYFTMRLPRALHAGTATEVGGEAHQAIVLRHDAGLWGSLAAAQSLQPAGIDPRHAVWIWRRGLETLGFVHGAGWSHGDVCLDHLLVHPADHGVQLISWGQASRHTGTALAAARERDLRQLAWSVRSLLHGGAPGLPPISSRLPAPFAALLRSATDDAGWLQGRTAASVEQALGGAAAAAFGAPRFVPYDPAVPGGIGAGGPHASTF